MRPLPQLAEAGSSPQQQLSLPSPPKLGKAQDAPKQTLFLDIETTPALVYTWGPMYKPGPVSPEQVVEDIDVLCFAAKWAGERGTSFVSRWDDGDALNHLAWQFLTAADRVVTYNGDSFDLPHLNRLFIQYGLSMPTYESLDLYKVKAKFTSKRLAQLAKELGVEGKAEHEGFRLWLRCMQGDPAAQRRMAKYNKRDVTLLEELLPLVEGWL